MPSPHATMQPKDDHIQFLDHIRGFAILIVFLFHCMVEAHGFDAVRWHGWIRDFSAVDKPFLTLFPTTFGWAGVSVFFVVSGFCIHLSHRRSSRQDVSTFLTRRFFRIYPPYLVALVITGFLIPGHSLHFDTGSIRQFVSHFFLAHNFATDTYYGINPSFWSIAVEFQLYLLYPLLMGMVKRWSWRKTLWIVGILEVGLRTASGIHSVLYDSPLPCWIEGSPVFFWLSWSIGAAAGEAFLEKREMPLRGVPLWVFPLLMVVSGLIKPLVPFSFLFAALSTLPVIARLLKKPPVSRSLVPRLALDHLRFAGIVSYSVYLIHQPVIVMVPRVMDKLFPQLTVAPLLMFLLCFATWIPIVAMSWLFYRWLELPSIDFGKRLIQRKAAARAPAIGA